PFHSTGTVDISVTTGAGSNTNTAADDYTYANSPIVNQLIPTSGDVAGGNAVVIKGFIFTGATSVTFGGVPATSFNVDSDTQITPVAPAGTPGVTDVAVTNANGTSSNTAADDYTYTTNTSTTLSALSPATYGDPITFTATVSPSPVGGTVTFKDNGVALPGS